MPNKPTEENPAEYQQASRVNYHADASDVVNATRKTTAAE